MRNRPCYVLRKAAYFFDVLFFVICKIYILQNNIDYLFIKSKRFVVNRSFDCAIYKYDRKCK